MVISNLRKVPLFAKTIADRGWHEWWTDTELPLAEYQSGVDQMAEGDGIPLALVAHIGDQYVGSVLLIGNDLAAAHSIHLGLPHSGSNLSSEDGGSRPSLSKGQGKKPHDWEKRPAIFVRHRRTLPIISPRGLACSRPTSRVLTSLLSSSTSGGKLLVHGARSCFRHLDRTRDRLGSWLDGLQSRMHPRGRIHLCN